jgi:hypothetical protein
VAPLLSREVPVTELLQPRLGSAVVSTRGPAIGGEKPQPSVEANDPATQSRNKRLFGVMLGTLQKFKKDLSAADEKVTAALFIANPSGLLRVHVSSSPGSIDSGPPPPRLC